MDKLSFSSSLLPAPLPSVRAYRLRRKQLFDSINVTPFIDVMLVLLIVFMVTAPLLSVGLEVELPQSDANPLQAQEQPLVVSIRRDGAIFLQDTRVTEKSLVKHLTALSAGNSDIAVYIRGDRRLRYAQVLRIMGRINRAGFERVSLVTDKIR